MLIFHLDRHIDQNIKVAIKIKLLINILSILKQDTYECIEILKQMFSLFCCQYYRYFFVDWNVVCFLKSNRYAFAKRLILGDKSVFEPSSAIFQSRMKLKWLKSFC